MEITDADDADVSAITAIFNDVLRTSTAIWREQPVSEADRRTWLRSRQDGGFPVLVAREDGAVVGFASFGPFRAGDGYDATVEHSIHVADGHRGRGVGGRLFAELEQRAHQGGKRVMVAGVDAGTVASVRFHEARGFVEVGRMPQIGQKFGRPVDLVLLQKMLP
jgi:phosphinothricin acetyltransferase